MEVEAVRDEAIHLPRRLRAGRATLMAGRSRMRVDSRRGPATREEGRLSLLASLSRSLYISLTRARDFFGTQEMDLNSIDKFPMRLASEPG